MRGKLSASFLDQVLLSAFNFSLNIVLLKLWGPADYGFFAFWFAVTLLCTGLQNSLVNTPLSVHVPVATSREAAASIQLALSSLNILFISATFVILISSMFLFSNKNIPTNGINILVPPLFVSAQLIREYTRSIAYGRMRMGTLFIIDGIYLFSGICLAFIIFYLQDSFDMQAVFLILSVGAIVGAVAGIFCEQDDTLLKFDRAWLPQYLPIWRETKWSLVGVAGTELQTRGYVYIVTAMVGLEALAVLAAGRVLFGPIGLLLSAWGRVARPYLAGASSKREWSIFRRTLVLAAAGFLLMFVGYVAVISAFWLPLSDFMYQGKYSDIGWVVAGWASVTIVLVPRSILSISLQSLRQFYHLAMATVYSGTTTLILLIIIVAIAGYKFGLIALIFGELITLYFIWCAQIRTMRQNTMDIPT